MPSINEQLSKLPKRRHSYQAEGKILFFTRTKLVMVPSHFTLRGWYCVVVDNGTYSVDKYNQFVSDLEIETALEITIAVA